MYFSFLHCLHQKPLMHIVQLHYTAIPKNSPTFIHGVAGVFFLVLHAWASEKFEYDDVYSEIS